MKKILKILGICVVLAIIVIYGYISFLQGKVFLWGPGSAIHDVTPALDQSISDGTARVSHGGEFSLATTKEQVLVQSYIPPCDEGFLYCLYYNGSMYKGTNFESAGLSFKKRADLVGENSCLTTPPEGYTNLIPKKFIGEGFATSVFSPIGDAGAGHYATGAVYRMATKETCYEFQTRIGESQFANYEPGSIKEFTPNDRETLKRALFKMIQSITLAGGKKVQFPE